MPTPPSLDFPNNCPLDGEVAAFGADDDWQSVVEACEHMGFYWVRTEVCHDHRGGYEIPRHDKTRLRERLVLADLRTIARNGDAMMPRENDGAWVFRRRQQVNRPFSVLTSGRDDDRVVALATLPIILPG